MPRLPIDNYGKILRKGERITAAPMKDWAGSWLARKAGNIAERITGFPFSEARSIQSDPVTEEQMTADSMMGLVSPLGINVFHGTGAPKFPKWDWNKIGRGAGGSVYSHGIYNSGDVEHAANYFDSLSSRISGLRYKGMPMDDAVASLRSQQFPAPTTKLSQKDFSNYQRLVNQSRRANAQKADALGNLGSEYNRSVLSLNPQGRLLDSYKYVRKGYANHLKDMRANQGRANALDYDKSAIRPRAAFLKKALGGELTTGADEIRGGIIKSELPDEYLPKMLRWDSSLYEQPARVQEFLTHQAPGTKDSFFNVLSRLYKADRSGTNLSTNPGSMTGSDIQRGLSTMLNPADNSFRDGLSRIYTSPSHTADPALSDILNSAGISGVKYRISGSNKNPLDPKAFNYVSYRDYLPKILDYYDKSRFGELGIR